MDVRILCKCVNHCLLYNNINCLCGRFQLSRTFFIPVIRVLSDTFLYCNWYLTIYGMKFESFLVRTSRFQAAKKHISITSPCNRSPRAFNLCDQYQASLSRRTECPWEENDSRTSLLSCVILAHACCPRFHYFCARPRFISLCHCGYLLSSIAIFTGSSC